MTATHALSLCRPFYWWSVTLHLSGFVSASATYNYAYKVLGGDFELIWLWLCVSNFCDWFSDTGDKELFTVQLQILWSYVHDQPL
jgi:hypothetical protein